MTDSEMRRERELDALFATYREACGEPEPSAAFMPALWDKIENRQQSWSVEAWRWARGLMLAAAAASLFFVMLQVVPRQQSVVYTATYLETLADAHEGDDNASDALAVASPDSTQSTQATDKK